MVRESPETKANDPPSAPTRLERRCLDALAVLVLVLAACIGVQVLASALGHDPLVRFDADRFLLGDAVSINTLLDLQWHLLSLIALLPAWIVWRADRHVRVDFLHSRLGRRARARIDAIGHCLLALPFLALSTSAAWTFAARALETGERATNGGMTDRWVVKATLAIGLALLLATVAADLAGKILDAVRRRRARAGDAPTGGGPAGNGPPEGS